MLTVRKDQLAVLEAMVLEQFVERLYAQLASAANEAGRAALLQEIRAGVALARSYHLTTERDVAALLTTFKTRFGSCKPDLPRPALSILTTWGVAPEDKLQRFHAWADGQPGTVPGGA